MAEPDVRIIPVDPYGKTNVLVPVVTNRMLEMAAKHSPEADPTTTVAYYMTQLYAKSKDVIVLALVEFPAYKVVGHAVGCLQGDGVKKWVFVQQVRADGNVGDAVDRALGMAELWGRDRGCDYVILATHRNDEAMKRRFGAKTHRYIMGKSLTEESAEVVGG